MLKTILARLQQGHQTIKYPDGPPPTLPDRLRGYPLLATDKCRNGCHLCVEQCPTGAITVTDSQPSIDMGKCLFCAECVNVCPEQALTFSNGYRLAARERQNLVVAGSQQDLTRDDALDKDLRKLFGRSLKLRQVSAGGCNACESDVNVLNTLAWDLSRFGLQFVASPRHADGLLVTGPVTQNMKEALLKTYAAVASPKIVIVVGACAISGGPYINHAESCNGVADILPVNLYIPGCPPHPLTILDGLLRLLGRG